MKQIKRIPVTKEGYDKLQEDLQKLQQERPLAVKNLAEARSMGDLSENGLYTAAKARLRSIDNQIFRIETQIKLADIIEGGHDGEVNIGSRVVIESNNEKKTYHIVGDYEANPIEGKITQHSPLGRSLIGKKAGEIAESQTPNGRVSYKILKVS